jgi:hypothetical protein
VRVRLLRGVLLAIACLAFAWATWLTAFGGFDWNIAGLKLTSNNPSRLFVIGAVALAGYFFAGGRIRYAAVETAVRAIGARPHWVALVIAIGATATAWTQATRIAGGPDPYGYVSQAEMWLAGQLEIPQPWAADVPWPDAVLTFAPLGYGPAVSGAAIVPTYSPGLPMLLAIAKLAGGQCALYAIVPLTLGLGVLATYVLGVRLGSPWTGVAAAWLVATSPVVLEVALESITDVPSMTVWSLAWCVLLPGGRWWHALGAGLLAGLGILIRPNLVALVVPMAVWCLVRAWARPSWSAKLRDAALFTAAVLPAVAAIAWLNAHWYGSPLRSGYGAASNLFSLVNVRPNLERFVAWIAETQTPLAFVGLAALAIPARRLWPGVADRRVFAAIGAFVLLLWAQYSLWVVFESAGFLRFLLASWPFMLLGLAAVLLAVGRLGRAAAVLVTAAIVALGVWQIRVAIGREVFLQQQAAEHEVPLGRLIRQHTAENSVMLTIQRSGSLRYYAGRMTLRYDALHPQWLDRAVAWLGDHGSHVYALLDAREVAEVRARFAGQQRLSGFEQPILIYEPASVALFDLSADPASLPPPIVIRHRLPRGAGCDPPVEPPRLVLR